MSALAEKMRKAREVRVESNGHVFVVLRPTPIQWEKIARHGDLFQGIVELLVDWDKFVELDLIPGGDPHPVKFDADACAEWLADHPEDFGRVADAMVEAMNKYVEGRDAAVKN